MKYFTKEWYKAMQCTSLHLLLRPMDEASTFSEELFQRLYAQQEQEYLNLMRRVSEVNLEELAAKFETGAPAARLDGSPVTEEEQKIGEQIQKVFAKALREAEPTKVDFELEMRKFHARFLSQLQAFEQKLPAHIREKIADIRLLPLRAATPEIIVEISAFCEANDAKVKAAIDAYRSEYKAAFGDDEPEFCKKMYWHDAEVTALRRNESDVILELGRNCRGRFRDTEIIKCDEDLTGAIWLYDEVYPVNGGYEIHALLYKCSCRNPVDRDRLQEELWNGEYTDPCEGLVELILRCSAVEIGTGAEKPPEKADGASN